jgi:hypothetical protein
MLNYKFNLLGCDCFFDIKCWCMSYVWVCVDLLELARNLNKVREMNKIRVIFGVDQVWVNEQKFNLNWYHV